MSEVNVTANGTVASVPTDGSLDEGTVAWFALAVNPRMVGAQAQPYVISVKAVGGMADDVLAEIDQGDRVIVHGWLAQGARKDFHIRAHNIGVEVKALAAGGAA